MRADNGDKKKSAVDILDFSNVPLWDEMSPDSVAQKQFPPNFCPTCEQIKDSIYPNIRSCHAVCDAFREPKKLGEGGGGKNYR